MATAVNGSTGWCMACGVNKGLEGELEGLERELQGLKGGFKGLKEA